MKGQGGARKPKIFQVFGENIYFVKFKDTEANKDCAAICSEEELRFVKKNEMGFPQGEIYQIKEIEIEKMHITSVKESSENDKTDKELYKSQLHRNYKQLRYVSKAIDDGLDCLVGAFFAVGLINSTGTLSLINSQVENEYIKKICQVLNPILFSCFPILVKGYGLSVASTIGAFSTGLYQIGLVGAGGIVGGAILSNEFSNFILEGALQTNKTHILGVNETNIQRMNGVDILRNPIDTYISGLVIGCVIGCAVGIGFRQLSRCVTNLSNDRISCFNSEFSELVFKISLCVPLTVASVLIGSEYVGGDVASFVTGMATGQLLASTVIEAKELKGKVKVKYEALKEDEMNVVEEFLQRNESSDDTEIDITEIDITERSNRSRTQVVPI